MPGPPPRPERPRTLRAPISWGWTGDRRLVVLAILIGLGGGLGAIAFRELIIGITKLATGHDDYAGLGRVANPHIPWLGPWFLLIVPVIGGLIYGPLLAFFAPEARGHGVPEVMLAVARDGGRIRPRVAVIKALASATCIGTGGSVGREGPIVQIGSALGSTLGQWARLSDEHLRLLVGCGAAAGISATFNTPIAGVFFAMEVILRRVDAASFGLPVLSSVAASAVGRAAFGDNPFLALPAVHVASVADYVMFAGLGAAAAVVGTGFVRVLYGIEDLADRVWRGPSWARPVAGGVLLGVMLLVLPELYGVGYPVLTRVVDGHDALGLVVLLLVAKAVATSTTIAIGGSGGVFAPSLFIGAMLGSAFGRVGHLVLGGAMAASSAYGVIGMGAVFAACSRAPMTAVLILFELTGDAGVILPAMLAIAVAVATAKALSSDDIYTLKLRRRGIDIDAPRPSARKAGRVVPAPRSAAPVPVLESADLATIREAFAATGRERLPVVDADHRLLGLVARRHAEREGDRATPEGPTALDLVAPVVALEVGGSLQQAVLHLGDAEADGLPVATADGTYAGWLTAVDVLQHLHGASNAERVVVHDPAVPVLG